MKLSFVALVAVLAVVQADRLCTSRTCGDNTSFDNPGGTHDPCFCDEGCEDADDCCDSYFTECIDSGCAAVDACGEPTQQTDADGDCYCDDQCDDNDDCCSNYGTECADDTEDTACSSCPDGPQQDTTKSVRGSCYCDDSCVVEGDCCPSYTKYCGDAIVQSDRAVFCDFLDGSAHAFCDNAMREAYYFDVEPKIDPALTDADWNIDAIYDTFQRTCLDDPEVIEGEVKTCYTNSDDDTHFRFGCAGLASVWAQECDSSSCRDSGCDGTWRRDFWGNYYYVDYAQGVDPNNKAYPREFAAGKDDDAGRLPSTAGQCLAMFGDYECDYDDPIERVSAWVYGCSDTEYSGDVEFLDWEKAFENGDFTGDAADFIPVYGNGDSTTRRKADLLLALSPFPWTQAFTDDHAGTWGNFGEAC